MANPTARDNRLSDLDLLRFGAAVAVTLYHYVSCYPSAEDSEAASLSLINAVTRYGYLGVDLFFMISGFVILWSSINRDALGFAISRASRLFPSFWVSIVFAAVWIAIFAESVARFEAPPLDFRTFAANATMVPAVFDAPLIEGVYWTLEIEARFYALIFLLLLFRQLHRIEVFLWTWLVVSIVALFVDLPWALHYLALVPYGPFFIAGCFLFLVRSAGLTSSRLAALLVSAGICAYISIEQRGGFITPDPLSAYITPCLVLAFFALLAWIALRAPSETAPSPIAYSLGALTYPLYLTHATMGLLLYEILRPHVGVAWTLATMCALALIVAWVMTTLVDIPARKPFANLLYRCANAAGLKPATGS